MSAPEFQRCYTNTHPPVTAEGLQVVDTDSFHLYLNGPVRNRLEDTPHASNFAEDLRGLATTEMASDTLTALLSTTPEPEPWQIGEALAECLLQDIKGALWPWNADRDKRTPRASLPGADLIGFLRVGIHVLLLLGEVKTSSDQGAPPNVMNGRSGMIHQIDQLAGETRIHHTLLKWLHARCRGTSYWPLYQEAVGHYLASGGKCLMLCGLLLRDTAPAEADLSTRAAALARNVKTPTLVALQAWYLPTAISEWPASIQGVAT